MIKKLVNSSLGAHGRYIHGAVCGRMGWCRPTAVDIQHGWRKEWVNVVEVDLKIDGLPAEFKGKRIVQISDLHCSRTVSIRYLRHCVERINRLNADIVVLTGDYITFDVYGRYRQKVVELISRIRGRLGVFACLGNHDYGAGTNSSLWRDTFLAEMVWKLEAAGIRVLVNEAISIRYASQQLWIVGLGDLWANDFDPVRAFKQVKETDIAIALSHNPETAELLAEYPVSAVLSGHTHGVLRQMHGQNGLPAVKRHSRHAGMYQVGTMKLYINRGLGRMGRALFNARPEITILRLQ